MSYAFLEISVRTEYVQERLDEAENPEHFFHYHVHIYNPNPFGVRILMRHWILTDGEGHTQEIQGIGIVGKQPHIAAHEHYTYQSSVTLSTPVGNMHGDYLCLTDEGESMLTPIAPFLLAAPHMVH